VLAGLSALAAGPLAARFGLINTMVFTHLPSNVLLVLVPFMPTVELAVAVLLVRFAISQMDVPTRQSYTMAVVDPDERSAAAGVTGVARSLGVTASPLLAGPLFFGATVTGLPFVIAGSLKIVYDLLLYRSFRAVRPPEESGVAEARSPSRRSRSSARIPRPARASVSSTAASVRTSPTARSTPRCRGASTPRRSTSSREWSCCGSARRGACPRRSRARLPRRPARSPVLARRRRPARPRGS